MEQKALIFGEDCINKNTFHKNKIPISIDRVDIEKIVLFKIDSYGNKGSFKYLIGCTQEDRDFPFSSTTMHKISSNKYLFFKTYPQNMLQKYNEIWNKISNLLKKRV